VLLQGIKSMKLLLFKLMNPDVQYAAVSEETCYLLTEAEHNMLSHSGDKDVLKETRQIRKDRIESVLVKRGSKEVRLYDFKGAEVVKLDFESIGTRRKFIGTFPAMERALNSSKTRIKPINALLVMLVGYAFIWAGTRQTVEDIDPEGIRWRIAYWTVQFLEWLNGLIGQKLLLTIGLVLILALLYSIFRPELWNIFGRTMKYSTKRF
jgi:hypothetical protein